MFYMPSMIGFNYNSFLCAVNEVYTVAPTSSQERNKQRLWDTAAPQIRRSFIKDMHTVAALKQIAGQETKPAKWSTTRNAQVNKLEVLRRLLDQLSLIRMSSYEVVTQNVSTKEPYLFKRTLNLMKRGCILAMISKQIKNATRLCLVHLQKYAENQHCAF